MAMAKLTTGNANADLVLKGLIGEVAKMGSATLRESISEGAGWFSINPEDFASRLVYYDESVEITAKDVCRALLNLEDERRINVGVKYRLWYVQLRFTFSEAGIRSSTC